jgi:hypothetical protein
MLHFCEVIFARILVCFSAFNIAESILVANIFYLGGFYNKKISCLQRKLYDKLTDYVLTI